MKASENHLEFIKKKKKLMFSEYLYNYLKQTWLNFRPK